MRSPARKITVFLGALLFVPVNFSGADNAVVQKTSEEFRQLAFRPSPSSFIEGPVPSQVPFEALFHEAAKHLVTGETLQGTRGYFPDVLVRDEGVRFTYGAFQEKAWGHFWLIAPSDLRGRKVRLVYSGIAPERAVLSFSRSKQSAKAVYPLKLEAGLDARSVVMEIPDTAAFEGVSVIELTVARHLAGRRFADFFVHRIEVLPASNVRQAGPGRGERWT